MTIRSILSNSSWFAFFLTHKSCTFWVLSGKHLVICYMASSASSRYLGDRLYYFRILWDRLHFFQPVLFSCGNWSLCWAFSAILLYFGYLCIPLILCLIINYSWKVYFLNHPNKYISNQYQNKSIWIKLVSHLNRLAGRHCTRLRSNLSI